MLKTLGTALLLAAGLAITSDPAFAIQTIVTQVDKNADGSMTYHFAVKLDQGESLMPGASKEATADFVTVYNFYGMVDGSVKSPPGWEFSSEDFGRTPTLNGYPMVLPLDVPNTPNLTWTATKPGPRRGADRRVRRNHSRGHNRARPILSAGHARAARYSGRWRRNGKCCGQDGQAGGHRCAPDAELPRNREITSIPPRRALP